MVADICSPAYLGAISSRSVLGISASHGPRWGSIWRDGSLNDVVTLFPPLSNPVWAETTQRDQATKYGWQQIQNTELATKPNTNYRACNKCKIQITRLTTNTKYRAGKKTELDQSQSLGLAAFLPEQPVEFHLHSCQNNLHNQFCNLQKDLKIHLPLQSQIKAAMIQL